jgi:DNA polymerase-1
MKDNKLLIIDGHNLLFQMFFGMPSRIVNKDGKAIQGILGFVGALIKMIKMVEPTHVAVLFDGEHENPRAELLDDYKANRIDYSEVPNADNPFSQLDDIYTALDCMGILHTEIAYGEADDAIAAYAYTYSGEIKIVIASFDSDFFQLINENVTVLRYRGDKTVLCDVDYVKAKFGILPEQYADFKALTGDSSDNIKGAEKVGVKTAATLLQQFGNLQAIIDRVDEIAKPSICEAVKRNTERLGMNYSLIKLGNTVEMPFTIGELKCVYSGVTTNEVLERIGVK